MMDLYNRLYLQMGLALAAHGPCLGAGLPPHHPLAEALPLVPRTRDEAMDRYFKIPAPAGTQVMRGTAATLLSIDYFDEMDFVRKMRVANLLTPFFALLCDNAPIYQGSRNSMCGVRTRIWQDVDHDRCGVVPHLMDPDFGFARYAENVLTKPQITAWRTGRVKAVGSKTAPELYAAHLSQREAAQILSISFTMCGSNPALNSAPQTVCRRAYIAAYAQLVKSVFGSPAALQNDAAALRGHHDVGYHHGQAGGLQGRLQRAGLR